MSPRLLVVSCVCAVVLLSCVVVDGARPPHHKPPHHRPNKPRPHQPHHGPQANHTLDSSPEHPENLMTPERVALYARITKELEARNYSRPAVPNGAHGVDISQWCGQNTWSCMVGDGVSFAIVRNYMESCAVDPNGVHSVANAWAAGVSHVDIYLYPSWTCGTSAAAQVNAAIDSMGGIPFGQLWFDIESGGAAGPNTDHAWLQQGVNQAVARIGGSRVGIYSSAYGWSVAMGSYTGFQSFPIWYAHYDNNPSFSDWSPFAGWTSPAMKQYAGDASVCGFDVDLNYY